jgi:hypothetical protein
LAGLRQDELAAIDTDGDGNYIEHFDTDGDDDVADDVNIKTDARIPDDIFERFNVYLSHTAPNNVSIPSNIVGVNGVGHIEIEGLLVINGQSTGSNGQQPQDLNPQITNQNNTKLTLQGDITLSVKKSIIVEKRLGNTNTPSELEAQGNAQIFVGQNYVVRDDDNDANNNARNNFGGAGSVVTFTLNGPGEQEVKYDNGDKWENFVIDKPSGTVILQGLGDNLDCFEFRMKQPNGTAACRLSSGSDLTTRDNFILDGGTFIFDNGEVIVGGSWLNNGGYVDNVILNAAAAVRFRPTTPGNYIIRTRGQVFYQVFFDNAGASTSTYTIEDGMRALARTTIGNRYVVQTANVPIGTTVSLQLTGLTVESGGKIDLNPGAELLMQTDASKITAEGNKNLIINGELEAIGTQDHYVRISRMGNDYYRFDINGRAAVRFYNIQFTDENGVDMRDGTPKSPGITLFGGGCPVLAVGTFSDGTFANGKDVNNATYLWLPGNYESQDVFNVNFPVALTSPGASNVRREGAQGSNTYMNVVAVDDPPVGVLPGDTTDIRYRKTRFINATGVFAGELFDRETAGTWTGPVDSIIVWSGKIKYWDGGGDGVSWHNRFNWTDDALPTIQDAVVIDHRFVPGTINIQVNGAFLSDNHTPIVGGFTNSPNGIPEIACRDLIIDTGGGNPINLNIEGNVEVLIQRSSPCPGGTEYGGDLTASSGVTIRAGNGFKTITVGKGWSMAGAFDYDLEDDGIDRARVVFNQNVGSRTITTGPTFSHFWDVEFQGGYTENNDVLFVDNDFVIKKPAAATYTPVYDASDVSGIKIYVGGDWINDNGVFVPRTGEVVFNGSGPQTITRLSAAGPLQAYEKFYDLRIQKPTEDGTVTLNSRVLVENLLSLDQGIFKTSEDNGTGNGKEIIVGQNGSWVRSILASPNTAFVDGPVGRIFQGSSVLSNALNFPIGRSGYAYTGGNSPAGSDGYALQVKLTNNNPTAFTMQIMEGRNPEDEDEDGIYEPGGDDGVDHNILPYAPRINMVTNQRYWKIKNIGFPSALPLDGTPAVAAGDLKEAVVTLRFDANQNTVSAPPPLNVQYPNVMADLSLVGRLSILQDYSNDDLPYAHARQATPSIVNTELPIRRGYASKGEYWRDIGGIGDLESNIVTISSTEPVTTLGNSRFTIGWYFIPLPVEVLSLQAKVVNQSQVQLDWVVVNESHLAYYGIERSTDGQQFEEIARVEARNSGETVAAYYHIDPAPHVGVNYYRLRQEEKDGKVSYSKVVAVEVRDNISELGKMSVYPNPLTGSELFVVLPHTDMKVAVLRLYDAQGRLVEVNRHTVDAHTLRLQFSRKPQAGVYMLSLQTDKGQVYYARLVIE